MGKHRCLAKSGLVKDWSIEERSGLAFFLERHSFDPNDSIFLENETEQKIHFIESGCIEISLDQIKETKKVGECIGELSLATKSQKKISATATKPTVTWVLTESSWEALKIESPALAILLLESLQQRVAFEIGNLSSYLKSAQSAHQ